MKPRIVLAGGSGFVGQLLSPFLVSKNCEVIVLTRAEPDHGGAVRNVHWNGKTVADWVEFVNGAYAMVNLTGRSINCRHTPENRREIIDSRVDSVRVLGQAIGRCAQPPQVFLQIAGVGIYGDKGERICDETTAPGDDFMTEVCQKWEAAFDSVDAPKTRKVLLRLGGVLGPNGGFLGLLGRLTRWFLGGQVGSGRQYISWIHVTDLSRMVLASIENQELTGTLNATSPNPVTNAEFVRELRRALHRPWSPPVPEFAARIGSWLMGTEASLALVSQRCAPKRFLENGFNFEFPTLRPALTNIFPSQ
ncbi:MAG: TIGR01777 family protein [Verrucomicrobia bacterium]|nr:MAG: TIGR01777 family protein [Verrucomicrobiota bacterium]